MKIASVLCLADCPARDLSIALRQQFHNSKMWILKPLSETRHSFSILRPGADKGKDIGAFIEAAKTCKADIMVCLGAHVRINSDGWLKRIAEVWDKYGAGLYGALERWSQVLHLRTTAFWCPPSLLLKYPWPGCHRSADRYQFRTLGRIRNITRYAMDSPDFRRCRCCSTARMQRCVQSFSSAR